MQDTTVTLHSLTRRLTTTTIIGNQEEQSEEQKKSAELIEVPGLNQEALSFKHLRLISRCSTLTLTLHSLSGTLQ
jgi:hypothetical protein